MIIDIGASNYAKRGDINFIYYKDNSVDKRHEQYDKYFPIKENGIAYYFIDDVDIITKLLELDQLRKENTYLFIHSFEHSYKNFWLLNFIAYYEPTVYIAVPNCSYSDVHDKEDKGHLFSFNKYSLENMLRYMGFKNIEFILEGEDLFVKAYF